MQPVKKMTKGKETSSINKDGSAAGTKDVKSSPDGKDKTELDIAREEVASLKCQLRKETDELCEEKDKHLYLQAEFDNAEKRRAKVWESQRKRMQADVVFAFLPLVDSFIPAVKKAEEGAYKDVKQLGEGLKSLKRQLDTILNGLNVTPIDIVNVPFDYNLHEVMQSQTRSDLPDDTVLSIIQVGWKLGADIIRPAKVVVSKKPAPLVPVPTPVAEQDTQPVPSESDSNNSTGQTGEKPESEQNDDFSN